MGQALIGGSDVTRRANAEYRPPWIPGIQAGQLADIPGECICSWVYRNMVWEVKFANASCPVIHRHREDHRVDRDRPGGPGLPGNGGTGQLADC